MKNGKFKIQIVDSCEVERVREERTVDDDVKNVNNTRCILITLNYVSYFLIQFKGI